MFKLLKIFTLLGCIIFVFTGCAENEIDVAESSQAVETEESLVNEEEELEQVVLPEEFSLNVPFTSQAPTSNWSEPYQEACEEAALLNVHYFYSGKGFTPQLADEEISKLVAYEKEHLGFYKDTTAAQTAQLAKDYWGYQRVEVIENPTVEQIKEHIFAKRPVVVLAAGRELGNPNFTPPGPLYHALVVIGYDEQYFYTNDVGTRHGDNYKYEQSVLISAIHDWNEGDVANGVPRVVVIYP